MKRYVIMIARRYPAYHSRKGQYTKFYGAILDGIKIHTIRKNFPLWEKRIAEVQAGKAILELRQWNGRPYRSKQDLLMPLSAADGVGIQRYSFPPKKHSILATPEMIAKNDGLSFNDFQQWFQEVTKEDEFAIIHFTPFRYDVNQPEEGTK